MNGDIFIDATLFLGMHSRDEITRRACKAFFVHGLNNRVSMSLEHVGMCDDVVWSHPRKVQDDYYPFMDVLHTEMKIDRRAYSEADLALARDSNGLSALLPHERLLVAMATSAGGRVVSVSPSLLAASAAFPTELEELYQTSLSFRVHRCLQ